MKMTFSLSENIPSIDMHSASTKQKLMYIKPSYDDQFWASIHTQAINRKVYITAVISVFALNVCVFVLFTPIRFNANALTFISYVKWKERRKTIPNDKNSIQKWRHIAHKTIFNVFFLSFSFSLLHKTYFVCSFFSFIGPYLIFILLLLFPSLVDFLFRLFPLWNARLFKHRFFFGLFISVKSKRSDTLRVIWKIKFHIHTQFRLNVWRKKSLFYASLLEGFFFLIFFWVTFAKGKKNWILFQRTAHTSKNFTSFAAIKEFKEFRLFHFYYHFEQ